MSYDINESETRISWGITGSEVLVQAMQWRTVFLSNFLWGFKDPIQLMKNSGSSQLRLLVLKLLRSIGWGGNRDGNGWGQLHKIYSSWIDFTTEFEWNYVQFGLFKLIHQNQALNILLSSSWKLILNWFFISGIFKALSMNI